ncbi:MAG: hypothetical protein KC464_23060, partial [Myxococcales bacterium]|nr:hypothetical protein [Myxococcales bacterium]
MGSTPRASAFAVVLLVAGTSSASAEPVVLPGSGLVVDLPAGWHDHAVPSIGVDELRDDQGAVLWLSELAGECPALLDAQREPGASSKTPAAPAQGWEARLIVRSDGTGAYYACAHPADAAARMINYAGATDAAAMARLASLLDAVASSSTMDGYDLVTLPGSQVTLQLPGVTRAVGGGRDVGQDVLRPPWDEEATIVFTVRRVADCAGVAPRGAKAQPDDAFGFHHWVAKGKRHVACAALPGGAVAVELPLDDPGDYGPTLLEAIASAAEVVPPAAAPAPLPETGLTAALPDGWSLAPADVDSESAEWQARWSVEQGDDSRDGSAPTDWLAALAAPVKVMRSPYPCDDPATRDREPLAPRWLPTGWTGTTGMGPDELCATTASGVIRVRTRHEVLSGRDRARLVGFLVSLGPPVPPAATTDAVAATGG